MIMDNLWFLGFVHELFDEMYLINNVFYICVFVYVDAILGVLGALACC